MRTKNYGLLGGTLDAEKHLQLAADPAAYMRKVAERPWAAALVRHELPRVCNVARH